MAIDYNADYANIQTNSGTWEKTEDRSLGLTGTARNFTATTIDNSNGAVTCSMEALNTETDITCAVSGIV